MKTSFTKKVFWTLSICFSLFCYSFLSNNAHGVEYLYQNEAVVVEEKEFNVLPDLKIVKIVFKEISKVITVSL